MARGKIACAVTVLLLVAATGYGQEFRSLEVGSWWSGFESAEAVTTLVDYADSCNLNCIIPEIRLRCDAYYTSSIEPPGTGVTISPPGFDPLADMIAKAHPRGIEVHPWLVTFRVWSWGETPTTPGHTTPEHIWWTHASDGVDPNQDWRMKSDTDATVVDRTVNLDPGHPAVEDYLITVFMDIVNRYDVDGLNLDYIRYPGTTWGYNPVAVARFNAEYGRTGKPNSSDPTWLNWRRDQITNLVKRLYLEIKAVKPWVKLSADAWASAASGDSGYMQNWDNWMLNHWMDFAHPMSYTSDNSSFSSWCDAYVGNQHGRHVYPLVSMSNSITDNVIPQIDSARAHGLPGLGLYAYHLITDKAGVRDALKSGPFPTKVPTPTLPWLSSPTLGMLKGFVKNAAGGAIYPATVTLQSKSTKNTGTGFYGFVDLDTGTYTVSVNARGYLPTTSEVTITAGIVSDLSFTLAVDPTPPVISNVRESNVQATTTQILWDTDEEATSRVEYGLTTAYGSQTAEDPGWVTAHTVQLSGLTANTLYHYRVKSRDAAGNESVSDDYTFTTASGDTPDDIIIDNVDLGYTLTNSWFTNTLSTDKYGINYNYCTAGRTPWKLATWTPTILVAGNYNVYVWYPQGWNRTVKAPYTVHWSGGSPGGGSVTIDVDQTVNGGRWNLIASAKPFLAGTAGYVQVSNNTGETWQPAVMADAAKFEWAPPDFEAPTIPTNVTATAISTSSIRVDWTPSTDNVAVTGYNIWRDGVQIGTSTTSTYTDTVLTANTSYSYTVSAYDAAGNNSEPSSPPVSRVTLSIAPGAGSVTPDWTTGCPTAGTTWTAVGGFGAGTVQYYGYAWDQNATYPFDGSEPSWSAGVLNLPPSAAGTWYLHLRGYNSHGVPNGTYDYPLTISPPGPVTITQWRSVRTHTGTARAIVLHADTNDSVESRQGGIQRIEVDFDGPIGLVNPAGVQVTGATASGGVPGDPVVYTPSSVTAVDADTLAIDFNPGVLPDQTCYHIQLTPDTVCSTLSGDTDCVVRTLVGDTTGNGTLNLGDALRVRARSGSPVADNVALDVDLDGVIGPADVTAIKALVTSPPAMAVCGE